jgi:rubrerythrin
MKNSIAAGKATTAETLAIAGNPETAAVRIYKQQAR